MVISPKIYTYNPHSQNIKKKGKKLRIIIIIKDNNKIILSNKSKWYKKLSDGL